MVYVAIGLEFDVNFNHLSLFYECYIILIPKSSFTGTEWSIVYTIRMRTR